MRCQWRKRIAGKGGRAAGKYKWEEEKTGTRELKFKWMKISLLSSNLLLEYLVSIFRSNLPYSISGRVQTAEPINYSKKCQLCKSPPPLSRLNGPLTWKGQNPNTSRTLLLSKLEKRTWKRSWEIGMVLSVMVSVCFWSLLLYYN